MMVENDGKGQRRPDPDVLLTRIQAEEQQNKRGKLKIFLGYAAGVGKTYAMLEAAHQRKVEGIDVVIGYVETHGRHETEELAKDLEIIPRKFYLYRNIRVPEMDLDAVLTRSPQLVLVDELAHSIAPGARHTKRYQDVEELLAAGIDVYTTLNIQHIESLNDVITQITGIKVKETIPDRFFDSRSGSADVFDLELIDLPPEELLNRLKEGKVYIPEQAQRAIQKFFRKGNLTALRELTMRRAAERVDHQMLDYMNTRAISGPWAASERLLVCISPGTLSEKLMRTGRRLADELHAEWLVVYVETPDQAGMSSAQRDRVAKILQLAEQLGAHSVSLPGRSVAETVMDYAHRHNITKVIAGKPLRSRWIEYLRGSVVDQLIRLSGSIDVYVVSSEGETNVKQVVETWQPHRPWRRYMWALALVVLTTGLNAIIDPYISPTNLVVVYLLAVLLAAIYLGRGPAILTSILSVAAFDYFFIPPRMTLAVSDTEYLLTFLGLMVVGLVISQLTTQVRKQAEAAQRRETQTAALYELGRDLTVAAGIDNVVKTIIDHISQVFNRAVAIFLPEDGLLKVFATSPGLEITENELAVATWAFEHSQLAGRGTDTLPDASIRCQPLKTTRGVVGILGVKPFSTGQFLTPDQRRTLDSFTYQVALAIERAGLIEQAHQAELMEATEKLQTALLNSISHDLRTPLVTITGALSSLEEGPVLDEEIRNSLIVTARGEADRLNRLVGNLLNMTRLEAGAIHLHCVESDLQELIGSTLEQYKDHLEEHPIKIDLPDNLPLIPLDFVLMGNVLINILDNAVKYSSPKSPIEIRARLVSEQLLPNSMIVIQIADRGVGIPQDDLERVFDKFYRVQRIDNSTTGSDRGTGLGLSICKGIVEAHKGNIRAENRRGGGTIISVELPIKERVDR